uniref:transposase n=1 Tax=Candidatus Nitrotoga sp. BS TaxID=2890408 RepID=UPI001EF1E9B9|nr:transposase [Candidatus Nitrotoga sp. BS]
MYGNGSDCTINEYAAMKFAATKQDCVPCKRRNDCLRTPDKTDTRQVSFLQGKRDIQENHTDRMKVIMDSKIGREMITRRFAIVEPVFGNLRDNKRLHRFTLRGKPRWMGSGNFTARCIMLKS